MLNTRIYIYLPVPYHGPQHANPIIVNNYTTTQQKIQQHKKDTTTQKRYKKYTTRQHYTTLYASADCQSGCVEPK
jgi:hypothetical protein